MTWPIGSAARAYTEAFEPAESGERRVVMGEVRDSLASQILTVRSKEPDRIHFFSGLKMQ